MKKIAFVCKNMTQIGGKERILIDTVRLLMTDYDVTIITFTQPASFYLETLKGVKLDVISVDPFLATGLFNRISNIGRSIRDLRRYFKLNDNYSKIICVDAIITVLLFMIFSIRKKLFAWEHMSFFDPVTTTKFKIIKKIVYKRLQGVIVLTKYDYELLTNEKFRVFLIPNFVTTQEINLCDISDKHVVFIGRYDYQKGFDYLGDIIKITSKNNDIKYSVLATGNDDVIRRNFLEFLRENKIESRVNLIAPTNNIQEVYLKKTILIMTSRFEGLPLVLLEAMSYGIPCISFDCLTGPADIIDDNQNGYLIKNFDVFKFSDKLIKLINDKCLLEKFSLNAKAKINSTFKIDQVRVLWKTLLDS